MRGMACLYLSSYLLNASSAKKQHTELKAFEPAITLIVAAYNEEAFINAKITNTLLLDYPRDKLSVIFVTDGSNDKTPAIVSQYESIRLYHQPGRRGKVAAINRVMQFVITPVVVFSDANTLLNRECLKEIAKHYQDPKVGGVAGEKNPGVD